MKTTKMKMKMVTKMTELTRSETIHERRRKAIRDVVNVYIFLDGINGAGEEVYSNYVFYASPGTNPIDLLLNFSFGRAEYLVEEHYGPGADSPNADMRYQSLTIVAHAGFKWSGMLVDGLKLDDSDPDAVDALLFEIAKMLRAQADGVKAVDAVKAWEKERAAAAV